MKTILPVAAVLVALLDFLTVVLLHGVPEFIAIYALVAAAVFLTLDDGSQDEV